jgi:hypothetical protein
MRLFSKTWAKWVNEERMERDERGNGEGLERDEGGKERRKERRKEEKERRRGGILTSHIGQ